MRRPHHPKVSRRNDGHWVVHCPECQQEAHQSAVPIGIGLPLQSEETANRLQRNHAGSSRPPAVADRQG